jgi:hypothetical protein
MAVPSKLSSLKSTPAKWYGNILPFVSQWSHHIQQIIVHASPEATTALIESCANIRAMTKDIYSPRNGESIQIGQQTNSFSISISDELLARMKMSGVGHPRRVSRSMQISQYYFSLRTMKSFS